MEPVTTVLICATVFGGVVAISAFIRQLLLSRDKKANDNGQRRALQKEAEQLAHMRKQLESNQRFESHYQILGGNANAIRYLDEQIDEIIAKKMTLIERYSKVIMNQSHAVIEGSSNANNKETCDLLKLEIDKEIARYNEELHLLQTRRAKQWDSHQDLQQKILGQEQLRNEKLDEIYQRHTGILEKLSLRHNDDALKVTEKTLDEGGSAFKDILMAPVRFLLAFFSKSSGIDLNQSKKESEQREEVKDTQSDLEEDDDYDYESDDESAYELDALGIK